MPPVTLPLPLLLRALRVTVFVGHRMPHARRRTARSTCERAVEDEEEAMQSDVRTRMASGYRTATGCIQLSTGSLTPYVKRIRSYTAAGYYCKIRAIAGKVAVVHSHLLSRSISRPVHCRCSYVLTRCSKAASLSRRRDVGTGGWVVPDKLI